MHDQLAGLRGRAGECRTDQEGIQSHLEELDQVLTGQALSATGLLEHDLQLRLADAVLGAQTLLLAKTHRVVGVGLALGAAVLPRRVRTLLQVFGRLRRERDAQRPRQAGLASSA